MNDPYLWLEERNGTEAVAWAKAESEIAVKAFEADPRFQQSFREVHDILTDTEKIPMITLHDRYAYNLWQDEDHQRGLWRRTSLQEYKNANPQWEILIDIDALAQKESQPWVFKGADRLRGSQRCLVYLSKNGQDATEIREFSMAQKAFVADGFFVPESKSSTAWINENHILVSLTLTEEQKTNSGYARAVYSWKRGQNLSSLPVVYQGNKEDVSIYPGTAYNNGKAIPIVARYVN